MLAVSYIGICSGMAYAMLSLCKRGRTQLPFHAVV